jgi:hypothetical protein
MTMGCSGEEEGVLGAVYRGAFQIVYLNLVSNNDGRCTQLSVLRGESILL